MYTVYMDLESIYSSHMETKELKERIRRATVYRDQEVMYSAAWSYYEGMKDAYEKVLDRLIVLSVKDTV